MGRRKRSPSALEQVLQIQGAAMSEKRNYTEEERKVVVAFLKAPFEELDALDKRYVSILNNMGRAVFTNYRIQPEIYDSLPIQEIIARVMVIMMRNNNAKV